MQPNNYINLRKRGKEMSKIFKRFHVGEDDESYRIKFGTWLYFRRWSKKHYARLTINLRRNWMIKLFGFNQRDIEFGTYD